MSILSRLGSASARIFTRAPRRGYGSAAAALDYDYYYFDDQEGEESKKRASLGEITVSDGWEKTVRGVQWVIMGDPMVRRHVYAERLAELLEVPHISMGSLVRQELNPDSPLHKKIAKSVDLGELVPEDVIFGLLSKRLEEGYCRGETGFILDGIPRTRVQAEILDKITDIELVLNLKCSEKSLTSRIYHPSQDFRSTSSTGFKDSETVMKEKLRMHAEQRKPLEEYYRKQKKLLDFQVSGPPGDTWQGLLAALHLQHMSCSVQDKPFLYGL